MGAASYYAGLCGACGCEVALTYSGRARNHPDLRSVQSEDWRYLLCEGSGQRAASRGPAEDPCVCWLNKPRGDCRRARHCDLTRLDTR